MNTPIRAEDSCFVPFSQDEVWRLLMDIEGYVRWWPKELGLKVLSSSSTGVGSELEINPKTGRSFRCKVDSISPPSRMEMRYLGGFVEGTGVWILEPENQGTRITYKLDTSARGWLVAFLGRLLDLGSVHSRQMQGVFEGLIKELEKEISG